MVFRRRFTAAVAFASLALLGLTLVGCSSGSGGDPISGSSSHSGEDQFEVALVRIAELGAADQAAFAPVGTDRLARGEVEVEEIEKNDVEVEVVGAVPNVTYTVTFCSIATGTACDIAVGFLTTDAAGNAEVEFAFRRSGTFAGVFVLRRPVTEMGATVVKSQFVTGFRILP